jgi:hypothetical protein
MSWVVAEVERWLFAYSMARLKHDVGPLDLSMLLATLGAQQTEARVSADGPRS